MGDEEKITFNDILKSGVNWQNGVANILVNLAQRVYELETKIKKGEVSDTDTLIN